MADSASARSPAPAVRTTPNQARHSAIVRVTHWITALCFFALLLSGVQILISHPRFYWGETGNALTPPLFVLPIPASRASVPTGYGFVLPDQNGWSRSLHFQSAWVVIMTGLFYVVSGLLTRHFRKNLLPGGAHAPWTGLPRVIADHVRLKRVDGADALRYNVLQRLTYLSVIFGLFPLAIWTGLAMSPAFTSAFPATVTVLGGQQSARTIHFFASVLLLLFAAIHILMVSLAGFRARMGAMITGRTRQEEQ